MVADGLANCDCAQKPPTLLPFQDVTHPEVLVRDILEWEQGCYDFIDLEKFELVSGVWSSCASLPGDYIAPVCLAQLRTGGSSLTECLVHFGRSAKVLPLAQLHA